LTSIISNAVASVVVSIWERACDRETLKRELDGGFVQTLELEEPVTGVRAAH
jgi:hypothetical protein